MKNILHKKKQIYLDYLIRSLSGRLDIRNDIRKFSTYVNFFSGLNPVESVDLGCGEARITN